MLIAHYWINTEGAEGVSFRFCTHFFMSTIRSLFRMIISWPKNLWHFARGHKSITAASIAALVLVGTIFVQAALRSEPAPTPTQERAIEIASVRSLAAKNAAIPLTGTITSRSEARIRTQTQGEVKQVYRTVGSQVGAGAVIAELENASERASVLQAQGGLEAAQANLAQTQAGARVEQRAILEENVRSAEQSLSEARTSIRNTLFSSRSTLDTVIRIRADKVFSDPETSSPELMFNPSNSKLETQVEFTRRILQTTLSDWNTKVANINTESDLPALLDEAETIVSEVRTFLENVTSLVNSAQPNADISQSTIEGWQNTLSTARGEVSGLATSLSSARSTLTQSRSTLENARQNLQEGVSGGRPEEVAAREAAVTQARGGLAAAQAQLEKTIVRSPITGTINTLPIDRGDFVQAFTLAAVVSNNQSLEVETSIAPRDRDGVSIGNGVMVANQYQGKVTSIAPGVNPETGKVDVVIAITDTNTTLTHGDTVRITIEQSTETAVIDGPITLPISAIKVTGNGTFVFTVNEENTLVAHEVELGTLTGSTVRILSGVNAEMRIVTDARGLSAGQEVKLAQ